MLTRTRSRSAHATSQVPVKTWFRFLTVQSMNQEKAREQLRATLKWREENGADTCVDNPHPDFWIIKHFFPQWYVAAESAGTGHTHAPSFASVGRPP